MVSARRSGSWQSATTQSVRESLLSIPALSEELTWHGYKLSAGTLYPLLHGLEQKGYLRSHEERNGRWVRKVYRATPLGRKALEAAKEKVRELFGELLGGCGW